MKKRVILAFFLTSLANFLFAQTPSTTSVKVAILNSTKFFIKQYPEDANGNPSADISLSYNNKIRKISKITGNAELIEKVDFASKGIPKKALSACGAWWAGAGDYFYVINASNQFVVYKGWQDETQTEKGYHWKKFKTFKTL
ncbi:hypothetical protein [Emticicia sp. SJ17W-69]|uniref:hypothetical protein n=1 Tax=Emticicia sp. SJ17W-69 TaxID=3421657 RepID=UPI003EB784F9